MAKSINCPREKNKFKRRGYLYESGGNIVFKCHNCGKPATLFDMIREFSPALYTAGKPIAREAE
jgi:transposase-like protein